jgi:hypothetical protein
MLRRVRNRAFQQFEHFPAVIESRQAIPVRQMLGLSFALFQDRYLSNQMSVDGTQGVDFTTCLGSRRIRGVASNGNGLCGYISVFRYLAALIEPASPKRHATFLCTLEDIMANGSNFCEAVTRL